MSLQNEDVDITDVSCVALYFCFMMLINHLDWILDYHLFIYYKNHTRDAKKDKTKHRKNTQGAGLLT